MNKLSISPGCVGITRSGLKITSLTNAMDIDWLFFSRKNYIEGLVIDSNEINGFGVSKQRWYTNGMVYKKGEHPLDIVKILPASVLNTIKE